ncbi:ISC system 2Fe-2S type ferredoxin [Limnobacter humi]|uniref:2Fe-2S ferredoxin n=1 Tax=Limnobacter humi TaxID=1778671 RepID=A0ABT1WID7_9BURK|nr:ISC system 2Fe-2S type ferredoxin [Limnobacter humi]MCQ8897287.1 ISC system 2Fe-2S type ferredoxin [Limnobacter humi]
MPVIKVLPHETLCPEGKTFEVATGEQLCESLLKHDIEIEHACEMSCACTTCHVIVREGFNSLEASDDDEDDLLDMAWGLTPQSRLSCQVKVAQKDLTLELPKYTKNHAREHH